MTNIMWLASYPKSGNTWMRAFLDNVLNPGKESVGPDHPSSLFANGESAIGWYRIADARPPSDWRASEIRRMRPRVHKMIADSRGGTVFCKTHNALVATPALTTVNMDVSAGAIYMVRNPLDVVLSFADFQNCDVDAAIEIMGYDGYETPTNDRNVAEHMGSWSQHVSSWTASSGGVHFLRYEDLLRDPFGTFSGVLAYLGQKLEPGRIQRAIEQASFKTLRKKEEEHGFSERPAHQKAFFRKGTAGQWRKELTPNQIERIVSQHCDQMLKFNYLPLEA